MASFRRDSSDGLEGQSWRHKIEYDQNIDSEIEKQIENILGLENDYDLNIEALENDSDSFTPLLGELVIKNDHLVPNHVIQPKIRRSTVPEGSCCCGRSTERSDNLTCLGQKCVCYTKKLPCIGCKCRGCRNPCTSSDEQAVTNLCLFKPNETVVENSWKCFQSTIDFEDIMESPISTTTSTVEPTQREPNVNFNTLESSSNFDTYDYGEFQDTRSGSELVQPEHLKIDKPTNSELWSMRKINEPSLAGYNPFRGDFEVEFENDAEYMVSLANELSYHNDLDDRSKRSREEHKLIKELQVALGESYNSCLERRKKRKDVIKQHGLLNQRGTYLWYSKLEVSLGKGNLKRLIRFSQLCTQDEAQLLYASLESLNEKRAQLNKLIFYRTQHGISTNTSLEIFESERKKRESNRERVDIRNLAMPTVNKRKRTRQIFHLPKFKELTTEEAELCSTVGLLPTFFLNTRDVLIADCKKHNGLLLKRARKLVKIDVNKTRKIFDLLMEQGVIWPPVEENPVNSQS